MLNLVGNAIKFTERGEVLVRSAACGRREAHCTLRLSVRDTGLGISLPQQQQIFDAFTQADASTTRRFGGTGPGG